jgi:hypothetical protein
MLELLIPYLAAGILPTDDVALPACFKAHTPRFVAAGASMPALVGLASCAAYANVSSAWSAAAAAPDGACPVRLAAVSAFAPAAAACTDAASACGACATAFEAAFGLVGAAADGTLRSDAQFATAACVVEHTALLLAAGVRPEALAGFAKCEWPDEAPAPPPHAAPPPPSGSGAVVPAERVAPAARVAAPAAVCGGVGVIGGALALRYALRARAARKAAAAAADAHAAVKAGECEAHAHAAAV